MSVCLVCCGFEICCLCSYRVISRKVSSVSLISFVNFMVSCSLFISFIYSENCSWDPVHADDKNIVYESFPNLDVLFTDVYKFLF